MIFSRHHASEKIYLKICRYYKRESFDSLLLYFGMMGLAV